MRVRCREVIDLAHHLVANLLVETERLKAVGIQINLGTTTLDSLALDGIHELRPNVLTTPLLLKPQKLNSKGISPLKAMCAPKKAISLIVGQHSNVTAEGNTGKTDVEAIDTVFKVRFFVWRWLLDG